MKLVILILMIGLLAFGNGRTFDDDSPTHVEPNVKCREAFARIINGCEVEPHTIPWQVYYYPPGCGGSVLDSKTILTAGHCCAAIRNMKRINVKAGKHDLKISEESEQIVPIDQVIDHPDHFLKNNDICILKLGKELVMNDYVKPVKLPKPEQNFTGTASVSGWGALNEDLDYPRRLQAVAVELVDFQICNIQYKMKLNEKTMMCAGTGETDSCYGDSGGPLMCDDVICGIVSFGKGCANPSAAGVYARVSHFLDFIKSHMNQP